MPLLLTLALAHGGLACFGLACAGRATPTPPEVPVSAQSNAVEGPRVDDAAALLAWFEGEGSGALVQLPVAVSRNPLGVTGGRVGGPDGLALKLDDGAMSLGLADRLQDLCGDEDPCLVWLEGVWGETVPMPSFGPPDDRHPFSVRRLVGRVEGDAAAVRISR